MKRSTLIQWLYWMSLLYFLTAGKFASAAWHGTADGRYLGGAMLSACFALAGLVASVVAVWKDREKDE